VKIGIIGTGSVGCACAMAAVTRGSAREIVLVNPLDEASPTKIMASIQAILSDGVAAVWASQWSRLARVRC